MINKSSYRLALISCLKTACVHKYYELIHYIVSHHIDNLHVIPDAIHCRPGGRDTARKQMVVRSVLMDCYDDCGRIPTGKAHLGD